MWHKLSDFLIWTIINFGISSAISLPERSPELLRTDSRSILITGTFPYRLMLYADFRQLSFKTEWLGFEIRTLMNIKTERQSGLLFQRPRKILLHLQFPWDLTNHIQNFDRRGPWFFFPFWVDFFYLIWELISCEQFLIAVWFLPPFHRASVL